MFGPSARDKIEVEQANATSRRPMGRRGRRRAPAVRQYPPTRALSPAELTRAVRKARVDSYLVDGQLLQKAVTRRDHVEATTRTAVIGRGGRGLRIVALRRDGLLMELGLRAGDVLKRINDRRFSRKRDRRRTIAELANPGHDTLVLQRAGQPITLDYVAR